MVKNPKTNKSILSVVYDHFLAVLKLNIRFISFLGKTTPGITIYSIILFLYFSKLLGSLGSRILGFFLVYLLILTTVIYISINFPPLRKQLNKLLGEEFILKYVGNPYHDVVKNFLLPLGAIVAGDYFIRYGQHQRNIRQSELLVEVHKKYWEEHHILASQEETEALHKKRIEILTRPTKGLSIVGPAILDTVKGGGDVTPVVPDSYKNDIWKIVEEKKK